MVASRSALVELLVAGVWTSCWRAARLGEEATEAGIGRRRPRSGGGDGIQ
jgi:hypothetical protein